MAVAGLVWAAAAQASTEVTFFGIRGSDEVDVTEIPNNVDKTYNIGGKPREIDGDSLQHVLNRIDIGPDEWSRLLFDDGVVTNGDKYVNNLQPVFYLSKSGDDVIFLIPKKKGEPAQQFRTGLNFNYRAAIDIDPEEVDAEQGETQVFEADVVGVEAQNNYIFNWKTSTGQTGTGKTFEVTFDTSGEVAISVSARRAGNVVAEGAIATDVKEPPPSNNGDGGGDGSSYNYGTPGYSSPGYTPPSNYDSNFPDIGPNSNTPDDAELPETEEEEQPVEEIFGTPVEGELLSAVAALPPASGADGEPLDPAEESASDPEEAVEEAKQINGPGALIAAGVVVGLLGLGAGREMENVRPRRLRRPNLDALRRLSPPWK